MILMPSSLYDATRHEPLQTRDWDEGVVLSAVDDIFNKTLASFDKNLFWKAHENEDTSNPYNKSLYFGAAGTLLGLLEISRFRGTQLTFDSPKLIDEILRRYRESPDTESVVPSYFLGEVGILLLHFRLSSSNEIADHLFQQVEANIPNPVNEALWGSPGTMLAALLMYRWTNEGRWKELFNKNADYLFNQWHRNKNGQWVWTQDLYGRVRQIIGAGHGFFGNVYPLLKGMDLLTPEQRDTLTTRIPDTLLSSARIDGDLANWPATFATDEPRILVQWCHGSPGIITSLSSFPKNLSHKLESALIKGGELIWKAGPLTKGASLCHGTDGNGYAFLTLYKRTGDSLWLQRARKFAMHAIEYRSGRATLWTGDIGLACYLISCIEEDDAMPGLDFITKS